MVLVFEKKTESSFFQRTFAYYLKDWAMHAFEAFVVGFVKRDCFSCECLSYHIMYIGTHSIKAGMANS